MVVLMEYSPGAAVKRKGAEEPGLFACTDGGDGDGLPPLSCRATKIRRLESAGDGQDVPAVASVGTGGDVTMGEAPPPSPGAADEERAVVVYGPADAAGWRRHGLLGQWRLPLRAGAEWIRDMLREADSRTVRAVLSSAQEEGATDLAVVPWCAAAPAPAATEEASTAAETADGEEDTEGTAAMDVEEERGHQTQTFRAVCGEGYLYRWPQHCMAPPPTLLPAVGQASPVMWSW